MTVAVPPQQSRRPRIIWSYLFTLLLPLLLAVLMYLMGYLAGSNAGQPTRFWCYDPVNQTITTTPAEGWHRCYVYDTRIEHHKSSSSYLE